MPGECLLLEGIVLTVKFDGCEVLVCRCFLLYGLGNLIPIHGKLNVDSNYTIIDYNVVPMLWQFYGLDHFYFQYYTDWMAYLVCPWPSAPKVAGSTPSQGGGFS
ncbi:hypothetical protein TNCV_3235501 [Trichonephila clavipes]|nr:hypothetical protein TNCV_3235501 [Trichonephila clavipes]